MTRPSSARSFCVALGAALALASAARADGDRFAGLLEGDRAQLTARLIVHPDDVGADRVRAGVRFELDPGWHIYWLRPGDTGIATKLRWQVEGGEAGPLIWPAPERFREDVFETRGYEGEVLLSTVATRSGEAPLGVARVDVELLACRFDCVPVSFRLTRSLAAPANPADARAFAALFATRPAPRAAVAPRDGAPAGGTPNGPAGRRAGLATGLATGLAFALLGGLLLNAMPCVLPVLAMKLVALAELARHSRREMALHAFAYTTGAVVTLIGIALAVVVARAAGVAVGWGFQFQHPAFLIGLSALLVLFAANLFGAFEFSLPSRPLDRAAGLGMQAVGARRAFFDGLLVVLLGTPCSAPFLGTAVGFATASAAPVVFAVFAAVGLGLAAPHWIVVAVPAAARWLPRSGAWTAHLRTLLGFGLLATIVWLLAVLARSASGDALIGVLALLVAVAAAAWIFGALREADRSRAAWSVAAASLATVVWLAADPPRAAAPPFASGREEPLAFDASGVRAALDAGRPAFVYFTADWCLTCKVNERVVLTRDPVRRAIAELDVAVFRADWTRRDEAVRAELARFGRSAVPFYLVYRPEAPEDPTVLPELLTVDLVIEALRAAAAPLPTDAA